MSFDHTPQAHLISFEDEVPTPGGINSDGGPMVDCPCELNTACKEKCCVDTVRELNKEKLARVRDLQAKEACSPSSYGSIDSTNTNGRPMRSPVACDDIKTGGWGRRSSEEEDSVTTPLIKSPRHLVVQSPTGGPVLTVRVTSPNGRAVRCGCHKPEVDHTTRKAVIQLIIASLIALVFMMGEVLGGYFANSLAIMTDAAHMLSDFAGFLISLFAIWVARRPPSRGMSFGWHRAEVIGAMVSVLIIWVLTGVLFYEAVLRVIHRDFEVDANIMLVTAAVGVFVNVFMCMVLGHSHGHGGHGHGGHGHGGHGHGGSGAGEKTSEDRARRRKMKKSMENINVRAAFIHVIGDLIQSIGVVIAGYIIWIWPEAKLADPICTFLFCTLVLFSTFNILKDALRVVMEGTPKHIDYEEVKADLCAVEGVRQAHSLHIWSLTLNRTALAAHLVLELHADSDAVLCSASDLLKKKHHITQTTLQVESHQEVMDDCTGCQETERRGVLQGLMPEFLQRKQTF